jgi:hypothetical protein
MRKALIQVGLLIVATIILGVVAMFVPPVWAACKCVYNEIKNFLIFPGSLIGSICVMLITYFRVKKGKSLRKSFVTVLIFFVALFSLLGFLIGPISDYINENDIPIFQPEFNIQNVPLYQVTQ